MSTPLLVATRNRHKLEEIRAILAGADLALCDLADRPDAPEVDEDGATFRDNAIKKAATLARWAGMWALADDSGLAVAALDGAPGVRSARYAGEPVDIAANNRKLLAALAGIRDRSACFRCAIALSDPAGQTRCVEGACAGRIADQPAGDHGFGYDPLFIPDGHALTFAQLPTETKNGISHRARALARFADELLPWLLAAGSKCNAAVRVEATDMRAHERLMDAALRQALAAEEAGEVPTGCVIVGPPNSGGTRPVLGRAHNQVEMLKDPTAHAEMIAITQAANALGDWRLADTILYVTKEPCAMCAGAIVLARIPLVVYGLPDPMRGGASVFKILDHPGLNHRCEVIAGVREQACRALFKGFFADRRRDSA
jgi:XTP/dITP diphosphohydrolase